ncbi:radical SAM protein [Thermogladius sp. 4427co]|uniref:radical SAM protein n=1 Tax=Thermogladius sp. 4427co TaxID=3450718 RepID=UPI003F78B1FE
MGLIDIDILLKEKEKLLNLIGSRLSDREKYEALNDFHARRKPRPCGLTIHTSIGCPMRCRYCYIYDMGFNEIAKPYPLSGLQLAYALLSNKYFIPTIHGTYLAIGSVSEPFHPVAREKAFEYIQVIYEYLGNPTQFSTKSYISRGDSSKLAFLSRGLISPLVSITTLSMWRELEPYAPSPEKRFETIRNLREAGLKPFVFIRPIMPGVTERDYREILEHAREHGAIGVVAGTLRVTKRIIRELSEAGLNIREILRRSRVPLEKMKEGIQYDIYTEDIKQAIREYAGKIGLLFFPSACMANLYTHGLACWRMTLYGVSSRDLIKPEEGEVYAFLREHGFEPRLVKVHRASLYVRGSCRGCDKDLVYEFLLHRYKICPKLDTASWTGLFNPV